MSQRAKRSLFVTIILMAAIAIAATFIVKANLQASTTPVLMIQTETSVDCGGGAGGECLKTEPTCIEWDCCDVCIAWQ